MNSCGMECKSNMHTEAAGHLFQTSVADGGDCCRLKELECKMPSSFKDILKAGPPAGWVDIDKATTIITSEPRQAGARSTSVLTSASDEVAEALPVATTRWIDDGERAETKFTRWLAPIPIQLRLDEQLRRTVIRNGASSSKLEEIGIYLTAEMDGGEA
jgi:hypothetical protein